jgi:hypothetical protein
VTRKQDSAKRKITAEDLSKLLLERRDLPKTIIEETLQQVLEAGMDEALQVSKGERTTSRLGYRAGYLPPDAGDASRPHRIAGATKAARSLSHGGLRAIPGKRKNSGRLRCWRCTYNAYPQAR